MNNSWIDDADIWVTYVILQRTDKIASNLRRKILAMIFGPQRRDRISKRSGRCVVRWIRFLLFADIRCGLASAIPAGTAGATMGEAGALNAHLPRPGIAQVIAWHPWKKLGSVGTLDCVTHKT